MASRLRTASTAAKRRMQGVHEVGRREGYVQKVDESSAREDAAVAEERVGRGEGAERTALELGDDREADLVRRVGPARERVRA